MTDDLKITSGILLNFARYPFILPCPYTRMDIEYLTVEHYFQAMKSLFCLEQDPKEAHDWVIAKADPKIAKFRGRQLVIDVESWDISAFAFMLLGQQAKFFQSERCREVLLSTGRRRLVEHRPDKLWGDNLDGTGQNLCGRSLMIVREYLIQWYANPDWHERHDNGG